jgi:hypothetical protein
LQAGCHLLPSRSVARGENRSDEISAVRKEAMHQQDVRACAGRLSVLETRKGKGHYRPDDSKAFSVGLALLPHAGRTGWGNYHPVRNDNQAPRKMNFTPPK